MKLNGARHSLVHELYLRTADETYIVARWCGNVGLGTDFLWNSAHALEKYLKAALLLNGRPIRDFNHDLVEMYDELTEIAGELLPTLLTRPPPLDIGSWHEEAPRGFLERLEQAGSPSNRYLLLGYDYRYDDLHKLDAMAYAIRRLVIGLDDLVRGADVTFREVLRDSGYLDFTPDMPLSRLIRENGMSEVRRSTLNLNFAFAPRSFDHLAGTSRAAFVEPVIYRRIFEPLSSDNREIALGGVLAAQWLLDNVSLPNSTQSRRKERAARIAKATGLPSTPVEPGLRSEIEAATKEAIARHGFVLSPENEWKLGPHLP
ncbi:hypothetical protein [Caulobacter sp. FWC26]|uniref:hypothetical protein n=1 Tax=Caulobacter sp. FWC26 TaxID=69665 RepID=UPI000C15B2BE|nr:hypothetical protein [Caulobacter sp. FWC26]AZS20715.1 hypothetical protein CSW63_08670 [Caulobacter sp. FWC26]